MMLRSQRRHATTPRSARPLRPRLAGFWRHLSQSKRRTFHKHARILCIALRRRFALLFVQQTVPYLAAIWRKDRSQPVSLRCSPLDLSRSCFLSFDLRVFAAPVVRVSGNVLRETAARARPNLNTVVVEGVRCRPLPVGLPEPASLASLIPGHGRCLSLPVRRAGRTEAGSSRWHRPLRTVHLPKPCADCRWLPGSTF